MHESRRLTFVTALVLGLAVSTATEAGSSTQYRVFSPPRIEHGELRAPEISPPVALIDFARALYAAVFHPGPRVDVYNVNTHETATFYIDRDGKLTERSDVKLLEHVFRCRRTGRRHKMHPGILRILADVASEYPGHVIEIVSAYRAPPFGVPKSKHFHGRAIDLRVRGVATKQVRDYLFRDHEHVGVGWYRGQNFVHVDYRPGYGKLGWTSPHRNAAYRYHPRWERRLRAEAREAAAEAASAVVAEPLISAR